MISENPNPDYKIQSDEQLLILFKKKDINAFQEIVYRYKDKIINELDNYPNSK